MKVVILAAGFATRLYPLTKDRAKPLLDVAGKPVLTHLLERVFTIDGIRELVVVTNAKFHAQFEAWAQESSWPCPVAVLDDGALDDDGKRGGVGDLALAATHVAEGGEDDVLILAGDNLLEFDLAPYEAEFRRRGAPLMLARHFPEGMPSSRFGELTLDDRGIITRFREKPAVPTSVFAATCIYFLPWSACHAVHEYLAGGGDPDAPGHFMAWLATQRSVHAVPFKGVAHDIGNLETLEAARRAYASGGGSP